MDNFRRANIRGKRAVARVIAPEKPNMPMWSRTTEYATTMQERLAINSEINAKHVRSGWQAGKHR